MRSTEGDYDMEVVEPKYDFISVPMTVSMISSVWSYTVGKLYVARNYHVFVCFDNGMYMVMYIYVFCFMQKTAQEIIKRECYVPA